MSEKLRPSISNLSERGETLAEKVEAKTVDKTDSNASKEKEKEREKQGPKFILSKQQKDDLREAFDLFDVKGCGLVERDFLKVAFRALGIEPTRKDIRNLVLLPPYLSYEEFVEQLQIKMTSEDEMSDVIKMFQIFDYDKTGKITYDELKRVAEILEEDVTDEEIQEMLDEGDISGDKGVEFKEFIGCLKRTMIL